MYVSLAILFYSEVLSYFFGDTEDTGHSMVFEVVVLAAPTLRHSSADLFKTVRIYFSACLVHVPEQLARRPATC